MLKIALIDDEKIVLRGIAALTKKEPGFELVGTAENGIDGLQMILETKPDIVMTDIRMPGMSGLEMIKKAKKEVPESIYIVFSGFNEFKYVKEAIGLGVIDYLEKPVTVPKLREVLKKAGDLYNYQKNYQEMTRNLEKADRVYVEKFLRDLYENPQKEEEILQMIMEKDGKFRNIHSVCVAKVCETQRQEIDDYREIIHKMTFEMIEGNPVEVYSFYEKECLMIVYFNFGAMEFPFREKLKKKKKEIEDREDLFTVGFSRTHREIYEISKAFEEAGSALQYARYLEMEEAVCIDEVEYSEPFPGELNQDQESLEFNFRMGQYEECRRQIQTYIGYLKSMDLIPELFVRKCRELLYLLQRMFNEAGTEKEQYLDIDYQELQQQISESKIAEWTLEQTELIFSKAEKSREDDSCWAVREVKNYVEHHYAQGISLDEAAENVHMSKTYLSMLFKKEEGITYIKYLTKIRMEKAMEFLQKGYKAKEVCEMVGYHDYKYFSTQFKKSTGMTLDNYKKSL